MIVPTSIPTYSVPTSSTSSASSASSIPATPQFDNVDEGN